MGLSVMNSKNPMIPSQNIHIEFVRLQDLGYEGLENLFECKLCDTIDVVFPFYNTTGQFKIVKTVWDVLANRYESMELGDLSVTLAEALGISNGNERTSDSLREKDFYAELMTGTGSVTAGTNTSITLNFPSGYTSGYRLLALNSITFSGTYSDYIVLRGFNISNANKKVTIYLKSTTSSSTVSYTLNVYGLFVPES